MSTNVVSSCGLGSLVLVTDRSSVILKEFLDLVFRFDFSSCNRNSRLVTSPRTKIHPANNPSHQQGEKKQTNKQTLRCIRHRNCIRPHFLKLLKNGVFYLHSVLPWSTFGSLSTFPLLSSFYSFPLICTVTELTLRF